MGLNRHTHIQRLRPHAAALGLYIALTVVALNNLVLHFTTAVPGAGRWDYAIHYWGLWWVKYALVNLHRNPLYSNYVFYPNNINLSSHTLLTTFGVFTAPLQGLLDLKLIYNGLLVGFFVAAGYFTFLFVRRHVQNDWLAALSGVLWAFMPTMISHASIGHLNLLPVWWLPLALLLWDNLIAQRRAKGRVLTAAGLGLTLYMAWMTDVQFMLWIPPLLAPYALYTWITQCPGRERWHVLGLALLAGVFMLAPAMIEPIPAMLQARGTIFPRASLSTAQFYSYQLNWLVLGNAGQSEDYMGRLIPLLTLFSLPLTGRHRQRWLWLGVGLCLFILALGPRLYGTNIPLPYLPLHRLLGGQHRTPIRFSTPAALALIMFIALSLANLFERKNTWRWQPWLAGLVMVGLVVDSRILAPFPIKFMPDYQIYHELGRDPEEYALLEVPVSPASGFTEFGDAPDMQYYSYIHHKQIINGTVSRIPTNGFDQYGSSALLQGLSGRQALPPLEAASRELAGKLQSWDMRYVLVHRDRLEPERARAIVEFLNLSSQLCLVSEEGDLLAYRRINTWAECPHPEMAALPAGTSRLALGQPGDDRYVGPGWYGSENIGGPQGRWAGEMLTSTLRVLLPRQAMRVTFNALAYPPNQTVTVIVNGQPVARISLAENWQDYQFDVPANILPITGPTLIELQHARLLSASERTNGQTPDSRPLAAAYTWFEFTPQAGQ